MRSSIREEWGWEATFLLSCSLLLEKLILLWRHYCSFVGDLGPAGNTKTLAHQRRRKTRELAWTKYSLASATVDWKSEGAEIKWFTIVLVRAKRGIFKSTLQYSTRFYLPHFGFPGIVGCWDRIQCCQFSCFFLLLSALAPGHQENQNQECTVLLLYSSYITYW